MSQSYSEYTTNIRLLESFKDKAIGRECEWSEKRIKNENGETTYLFSFYCEQYTFSGEIHWDVTAICITERTEDNPMGKNGEGIKCAGMTILDAKAKDLRKYAKIFFSYVPYVTLDND